MKILVTSDIDYVDRVICGVSDKECFGFLVDRGVVKAAFVLVFWKIYETNLLQIEPMNLLCRLCEIVF